MLFYFVLSVSEQTHIPHQQTFNFYQIVIWELNADK